MAGTNEPLWRRYLRFGGADLHADIEDEICFHLEMRERDLVAEGKTPEQARELAEASFGDIEGVREWLREHDRNRQRRKERVEYMDQWLQDLKYGLRKLKQQPGFTGAAIAVLALGIGATAAIFSTVDAVLLRPLPFAEDDRLVLVDEVDIPLRFAGFEPPKSQPDINDLAAQRDVFSSVAAYAPGGLNLSGTGEPVRVRIGMVTPSFFPTLGVRPILGRTFTPEEGVPEGSGAAVLSERLWRRHFGGDPGVLNERVELNGKPYQVVGVMPRGFGFPSNTELWLPMPVPMTPANWEPFRQYMPSRIVARLAAGVGPERAEERVLELVRQYATDPQAVDTKAVDLVQPLRETLIGDRRNALFLLLGATGLVLLIACANVATLLLARALGRRQEMAVRSVLGATSGRIIRQLLVESVLLALAGGVLGLLVAWLSLGALQALIPSGLAGAATLRMDWRVLVFTLVVVLLSGIAFGLWPALSARRSDVPSALASSGARGTATMAQARARRLLVVAEIALALMLLTGSSVLLRSFQMLVRSDTGVEPERVGTLELTLARATYESAAERRAFLHSVLARLDAIPEIEAAAFVNELPLRGQGGVLLTIEPEGAPEKPMGERVWAQDLRVTPDYFRALGIPIRRGRTLAPGVDSLAPEIVVNEELARLVWPGENPLGKRIVSPPGDVPAEVVGVVANVRPQALDDDEVIPQMYHSLLATPYSDLALVARGRVPAGVLAAWLRQGVRTVAPEQAVYNVRTMEQVISETIAPRRTNTLLITLFGVLAGLLAAMGIYGVTAYGISRRTREFGIRIALGARSTDVLGQVLRDGMMLAAAGIALGFAGAWAFAHVLGSLVYGISPRDPAAFIAAAALLLGVMIVATLIPARRATRIDPAAAIRME